MGGPLPRSGPPGAGGMMLLDPRYTWIRQLAVFAVLLAIWEAAGRAGMLNPMYVPKPSRIGSTLVELFSDSSIWHHLDATFTDAISRLATGISVSIPHTLVA